MFQLRSVALKASLWLVIIKGILFVPIASSDGQIPEASFTNKRFLEIKAWM